MPLKKQTLFATYSIEEANQNTEDKENMLATQNLKSKKQSP